MLGQTTASNLPIGRWPRSETLAFSAYFVAFGSETERIAIRFFSRACGAFLSAICPHRAWDRSSAGSTATSQRQNAPPPGRTKRDPEGARIGPSARNSRQCARYGNGLGGGTGQADAATDRDPAQAARRSGRKGVARSCARALAGRRSVQDRRQ